MVKDPTAQQVAAWQRQVREQIRAHPDRPHKTRALARTLQVADEDYTAFRRVVRDMVVNDELVLGARRTLHLPDTTDEITGVFHAHDRGFGFLEHAADPDIFIPRGRAHGALDGDKVAVRMLPRRDSAGRTAGEVIRIIERAPLNWVGVLERNHRDWFVRPQGKAGAPSVYIEDPTAKGAVEGDLVVVEPLEHTLRLRTVRGVITERIGPPSDARNAILAVIRRYALPHEFPGEVRRAAQDAAAGFEKPDTSGREDLTKLLTITIDPPDARDFDDAISIENRPNGVTRLGVHIADVAHFVRAGEPLDNEARERGNSVYFPQYVVPMLPEVLSNGVCSLQPEQLRFTKSVFIDYDKDGRVRTTRFTNSFIRSAARLTYDQVTGVIDGRVGDLPPKVVKLIQQATRLARTIRKRRLADGMLVLSLPEQEVTLDCAGKVTHLGPADTSFSHTVIEMFMVEANEAISRLLKKRGIAHLRRIHPKPEAEASRNLIPLRPLLGDVVPQSLDRASIQALLAAAGDGPAAPAVNYLLLRSLSQASYSPAEEGHFALASEDYCHFTSPIRRYADLTIHRQLDEIAGTEPPVDDRIEVDEDESDVTLAEIGRHVSATERRAQQAEREAKNTLSLMFMSERVGEELEGLIVGTLSIGVFVQLQPYLAEGLVRVSDFGQDVWEYHDKAATFVGLRTRRLVTVGQTIRVVVAAVDIPRQEMDLVPAEGTVLGIPLTPDRLSELEVTTPDAKRRGRKTERSQGGQARESRRGTSRGQSRGQSRKSEKWPPRRGRRR